MASGWGVAAAKMVPPPSEKAGGGATSLFNKLTTKTADAGDLFNLSNNTSAAPSSPVPSYDPSLYHEYDDNFADAFFEFRESSPGEKIYPPAPSFDPSKYTENSSQTFPGDFFLFHEHAVDAVGYLVADSVKSSIYELCIEEEQTTMEKHLEEFDQLRRKHLEQMARIQLRTHLVTTERLNLEQADEIEDNIRANGKEVKRNAMFSSDAAGSVIHDAMRQLESDGFFGDLYRFRVESQFIPWLNSAVELFTRDIVVGYQNLDDIVEGVVLKRDEELEYANYHQSRSTKSGSLYGTTRNKASIDSLDEDFFNNKPN